MAAESGQEFVRNWAFKGICKIAVSDQAGSLRNANSMTDIFGL